MIAIGLSVLFELALSQQTACFLPPRRSSWEYNPTPKKQLSTTPTYNPKHRRILAINHHRGSH
jgi:hypothetical protein